MSTAEIGTKNYCAGEDQQQFTGPDRPTVFKGLICKFHTTPCMTVDERDIIS
jgi:hypothetical protein